MVQLRSGFQLLDPIEQRLDALLLMDREGFEQKLWNGFPGDEAAGVVRRKRSLNPS
jgi:hypothetical protein